MRIERGIQPNCSELVIRLPGWGKDTIRETLYINGIIDTFTYKDRSDPDWDGDEFGPISYKEMDPKVLKLYDEIRKEQDSDKYDKLIKKLKKLGYEFFGINAELREKNSKSDDEYGSNMWISTCEDETTITYHQHCQTQGFPLLRRVSQIFNSEVEADDGGNIQDYNEWLDNQYTDREENYN
jgi:hypothetical protein